MNEALKWSYRWLAQRSLSEHELRQRLEKKELHEDEVSEALQELRRRGYINDTKLAEQMVRQGVERRQGPAAIRVAFLRRGIPPDIIEETWREHVEGGPWQEIARSLEARYDVRDPKERARLVRRLARHGFPPSVIRDVLSRGGERSDTSDGVEDY